MKEAFRALLTSSSAVTSLVPIGRINFGKHPQGAALPGIVLNVVSDGPYDYSLDGAGIRDARVQVDIYAAHYGTMDQIQGEVIDRLDAYNGGAFQMIGLLMATDRAEEVATNSPIHRAMLDFRVIYTP
jgi:hypothetical protein